MRIMLVTPLLLAAPLAAQQDAASILRTAAEKQAARESSVQNYTLIQTVVGMEAPSYFEKETLGGGALFRLVPISEWQKRRPGAIQDPAAMASGMALGLDMLAGPLASKLSGAPGGAMVSGYMSQMMSDMSTFLRAGAEAEQQISDGRAEAVEAQNQLAMFATRARLAGTDDMPSGQAFHLLADNLGDLPVQTMEGGTTMTMVDANMWIDAAEYVPVRLLMHAVMGRDGRKVPITIEMQQLDYKAFGPLYQSTHQIMRLEGLMEAMSMDPKQRQEMEKARRDAEKARRQMADMDAQLAAMPAAARRMVQGQMDKAMAQLDMIINNGAFESEVTAKIIGVNEGPPFDWIPMVGAGS